MAWQNPTTYVLQGWFCFETVVVQERNDSSEVRRILVVEDEAIVAEALARRLRADGWTVVGTPGTGRQALALCSTRDPDVVLMDIRLRGGVDGIEVASEIRGLDSPAVVFLTAHSDPATIERAKEVGPAGYLLKPFSDAQLRVTLETAYHVRQVEQQRRLAEVERRIVDAQLRAILEQSPDPILAFSSDGLRFHSDSAIEAFGFSSEPEALRGVGISDLLDVGALGSVTIETIGEASESGLLRGLRRDGLPFEARATASRVENTDLIAMIVQDVTTERAIERQVRDAQRMEAVGRVTASVAHDFNNVLSLIKGYAVLVRESIHDDEVREDLQEILGAVDHGAALTRKLLAFAREEQVGRVSEVNDVLRSVARLLTRVLPPNVETHLALDDAVPPVQMARTALEQVILNLALNARDAMPTGGILRLETRALDDAVELRIADTGQGMDEPTLNRVFEPFFTTKPLGRGTGLGLTIVRSVLREVGGNVVAQSSPGVGTEFVLEIPAADHGPEVVSEPPAVLVPNLIDKVVMVVDDEAGIRSVALRALKDHARSVVLARHGIEALRLAEEHDVDVLVVDLVLPDLPGHAVARRLQAARPDLRVLTISGYPTPLEDTREMLAKPFGPDQLLEALQRLLDG